VVYCDAVRNSEMAVPFIGRRGEWRGREAGGEAPTGGASITHRLLEEEATGQRPFKGKMKRRRWRIFSFSTWRWRETDGGMRSGDGGRDGRGGIAGWRLGMTCGGPALG
jgi:hypothetical protein